MLEAPNIQWFPGHMTKTRRLMEANLKQVDIVVELLDARIPQSSRNPEIDRLVGRKPRVVVLNKCDAADPKATAAWAAWFEKRQIPVVPTDCRSGKGIAQLLPTVRDVLKEELHRREARGMAGKPVRMMIVGIPNVGKSSLINKLAGSKRARVEDRPGVTRGKQWVTLPNGVDLLDMPGVLWPKFQDPLVGERLAFIGSVKDDILDVEHLAMRLLLYLREAYPQLLASRYGLEQTEIRETEEPYELLCLIGRKRGMLVAGGEVNTERAAIVLLDEFRGGKLGRISLELPQEAMP